MPKSKQQTIDQLLDRVKPRYEKFNTVYVPPKQEKKPRFVKLRKFIEEWLPLE